MAKKDPLVLVTMRKNFADAEHGTASAGDNIQLPRSKAKHLVDTRQAEPANDQARKQLVGGGGKKSASSTTGGASAATETPADGAGDTAGEQASESAGGGEGESTGDADTAWDDEAEGEQPQQ